MPTPDTPPDSDNGSPSADRAPPLRAHAPEHEPGHEPGHGPGHENDDAGARELLAKLNKVAAPPDLASRVPDLIQRRSAGRFFGKRRLADRLPLEWLSLIMLLLLALIYAVLRMAPAFLGSN
jgi:hypothetical protein